VTSPETPYPLHGRENAFGYAGGGDWGQRETCVSCRDGFLPWVIVGIARHLYAHEFIGTRARSRLKLLENARTFVATMIHWTTTGFGVLQGLPPQASHCNNIGAAHQERITRP
jgi:hypothetical protein